MWTPPRTPLEDLQNEIILGRCYVGPDAARAIAGRVQGEHGFWDFEERKRLWEQEQLTADSPASLVLITGGKTQRCSPPGGNPAESTEAERRSA